MRPAWSIIVFTSLSGLGLGMLVMLGLGLVPMVATWEPILFGLLAMVMVVGGLMSSLLHLGHPERAWRALSQWRSSWLSREGVSAVVSLGLTTLYLGLWWLEGDRSAALGLAVAISCVVTVWTTAMIYGSLKTVARWYHPLTPWVYVGLSVAGGLVVAAAWAQATHGQSALTPAATLVLLAVFALKARWWVVAGAAGSGSTPESATGLGAMGHVDLLMSPHTEENWLQHEMGFVVARKHRARLAQLAVVLALVIPLLGLWFSAHWLIVVMPLIHYAGILVERWLFFADAKHVVTLFYGDRH